MLDAQRLPFVHAQRACALPIAIAFWPVLLAVTGLAIDLFSMHGHSGAVQILLADHWGGDSGMVRCSYGPPRTDACRKGDQQGGQWAGFQNI